MTIKCPKCGKELPDESKFCLECGCHIYNKNTSKSDSNLFSNFKIFLILIFIVLIIGGVLIFSMGGSDNNQTAEDSISKEASEFSFTISDVNGYYSAENNNYFIWTEVLFQKVPSNQKDYIVKVTYLDGNNTDIGHEIDNLANIYYDADYALSVGYHTSYKYMDIDSVKVEIIKDDQVIKEATSKVDKNKFNFNAPKANQTK